jgi:hypothetical protein
VTLSYDPARLQATLESIPSRDHSDQPIMVQRLAVAEPRAEERVELTFAVTVG